MQEAVTTSLLQFLRYIERTGKVQNCARLCNFVRPRKNTYISKLMNEFSGDNYVFFQFVHYWKEILPDNQAFTGLRDGSPVHSLGSPQLPYGALPKICLSSKRYMQGDFLLLGGNGADVRDAIDTQNRLRHPNTAVLISWFCNTYFSWAAAYSIVLAVVHDNAKMCQILKHSKIPISTS